MIHLLLYIAAFYFKEYIFKGDDVTSSTSSTNSIEENLTYTENNDEMDSLSTSSLRDYDEMLENLQEALISNEETQIIKNLNKSNVNLLANKNYKFSSNKIGQKLNLKPNKKHNVLSNTEIQSRSEENYPDVQKKFPNTVSTFNFKKSNKNKIYSTQKPTISSMGVSVMTQKIENMRDKCKNLLGREKFLQAYDIITKIRFDGDAAKSNLKILKNLEEILPDTSKCMLLEELVFLEQEKFRSTFTNKI